MMGVDALVRAVSVNVGANHILFTGAGASVTSGVPSAAQCIWDWKRRIFLSRNPGLENQFSEISLQIVKSKIQSWLDNQGDFPAEGDTAEYSQYLESCFPIPSDRKKYFEEISLRAMPGLGYRLLPMLISEGIFSESWTTNFDGIVDRMAARSSKSLISVAHDSFERVSRPQSDREFISVCLHGDYRYGDIKNTDEEFRSVREADEYLRKNLKSKIQDRSILVVGYSGRDRTVMDTFREAFSIPGNGRLYWCIYGEENVPKEVDELITFARSKGREAFIVKAFGFDDLMSRLIAATLHGEAKKLAEEIVSAAKASTSVREPMKISGPYTSTLVKSNLLEIVTPVEIFKVDCDIPEDDSKWDYLRSLNYNMRISAGILKGSIYCLGELGEISSTFEKWNIKGITRVATDKSDLHFNDSTIVSIMNSAVVKYLSSKFNFSTDGRTTLWDTKREESRIVLGHKIKIAPSIKIKLRMYNNKTFLACDPSIVCLNEDKSFANRDVAQEAARQVLGRQWNKQFDMDLDGWLKIFFADKSTQIHYPIGGSSVFEFEVRNLRVLGQIFSFRQPKYQVNLKSFGNNILLPGARFHEPSLCFSSKGGLVGAKDINGLRGLLNNRPYDYALTSTGILPEIKLSVICEKGHEQKLFSFLNQLQGRVAASSKVEYLIDYPGFAKCLGTAVDIPVIGSDGWVTINSSQLGRNPLQDSKKLVSILTSTIDQVVSSKSPNVVLVYVPSSWRMIESIDDEKFQFDLHDTIKAFCVQKGVATQFLREATLEKKHTCEIIWWLALSLYIKSRRSPWILENLEPNTAFAGIGYSQQHRAGQSTVLLGCSHIYTAEGVGLNYKLSKVENPIYRRKKPYLSEDDARRVGEGIRQLYFESKGRLPERVVIHKRTPFIKEEISGLKIGLAGVKSIELLELAYESMTKFTAQMIFRGELSSHAFPIGRGTALVTGENEILLWLHGNSLGLSADKSYYLGKNRIPAPLVVRRYLGSSPMQQISQELMGLSKIGLNSFDLYNQMPATLDSSAAIARIGALLDRFGSNIYDYRLFI